MMSCHMFFTVLYVKVMSFTLFQIILLKNHEKENQIAINQINYISKYIKIESRYFK